MVSIYTWTLCRLLRPSGRSVFPCGTSHMEASDRVQKFLVDLDEATKSPRTLRSCATHDDAEGHSCGARISKQGKISG